MVNIVHLFGVDFVNTAEILRETVGMIDMRPKLPITVSDELPIVPSTNMWLDIQEGRPKAYCINYLLENKEEDEFTKLRAIFFSSYEARTRAQIEFLNDLELFPSVDVKYIGGFRDYILEALDEDIDFEVIDCNAFAQGSCCLWDNFKEISLLKIQRLVPRNARHMIRAIAKIQR